MPVAGFKRCVCPISARNVLPTQPLDTASASTVPLAGCFNANNRFFHLNSAFFSHGAEVSYSTTSLAFFEHEYMLVCTIVFFS